MSVAVYGLLAGLTAAGLYALARFQFTTSWPLIGTTQEIGGSDFTRIFVVLVAVLLILIAAVGCFLSSRWIATTRSGVAHTASALLAAWNVLLVLVAGSIIAAVVIGWLGNWISNTTAIADGKPAPEMAALLAFAALIAGLTVAVFANLAPRISRPHLARVWLRWQFGGLFTQQLSQPQRWAYAAVNTDVALLEHGIVNGWGYEAMARRLLQVGMYLASDALSRISLEVGACSGQRFAVTVRPLGPTGRPLTSFQQEVQLSCADPAGNVADVHTFTAADNATHTFELTLQTVGRRTINIFDAAGTYQGSCDINVT